MDELVDDSLDQCASDLSVSFDVPSPIVANRYSGSSLEHNVMEQSSSYRA